MPPAGRKAASDRSIIRLTLFAGFGLIIVLWAASSYDVIRRIADTRSRTNGLHDWFTETEHLLDEVRLGVLEASVDVRDALLDTRAPSNDFYRGQLQQTRAAVERALVRYAPYTDAPAEKVDFADLRAKVEDFWSATGPILDLDEAGRTAEALDALRRQIVPRRDSVHRMSVHIARLNSGAAGDQRRGIDLAYRAMQQRVWITGGLALLLSLGAALVVTRHADRLERQLRHETAKNAASVLALQRLSVRLVRAQDDERRTIARELHDEVGQALSAMKMQLARAPMRGGKDDGWLTDAREIADTTLQNVRNLSRLLHPMVLEDLGLRAAVDSYLRDFERRTGIQTEFQVAGVDQGLAPALDAAVYRIVQEATGNVARHSGASACTVTLRHAEGLLTVAIEDNGRGFDAGTLGAVPARGLGLVSIRERATAFGGTVSVHAAPGRGTRVAVGIPTEPALDGTVKLSQD